MIDSLDSACVGCFPEVETVYTPEDQPAVTMYRFGAMVVLGTDQYVKLSDTWHYPLSRSDGADSVF